MKRIIFIIMEPIPSSIDKFIKTAANVDGNFNALPGGLQKVPFLTMENIYVQLGSLLDYLEKTYGFYHRDLHPGNVLLTEGARPTIKLIDYGRCKLDKLDGDRTIGKAGYGTTYRAKGYDGDAPPYNTGVYRDLLLFIIGMHNFYARIMTKDHQTILLDIVGPRDTGPTSSYTTLRGFLNYYKQLNVDAGNRDFPLWHAAYPYAFSSARRVALLEAAANLRPANFVAEVRRVALTPAAAAGGSRQRRKTTRRGSKKRASRKQQRRQ
jgi:serine/threonine protein kinase